MSIDLGSGSGMDVLLFAAERVGATGSVVGIDYTAEQLEKAQRLAEEAGYSQVDLREARIEELPIAEASCDCVISNGVINLAPQKGPVFPKRAPVLKPADDLRSPTSSARCG